jgi:hypothetical protein
MGLLIWKALGYGIVFMVGFGFLFMIAAAAIRVLAYAAAPFIFVAYLVLGSATYPFTLYLRKKGYQHRSFFIFGQDLYKRFLAHLDGVSVNRSSQQSATSGNEQKEYHEQKEEKVPPKKSKAFDPWEVLGVSKSASKDDIIAAYKVKMKTNHPDKVASLDPELQRFATKRTVLIKQAYDHLMALA